MVFSLQWIYYTMRHHLRMRLYNIVKLHQQIEMEKQTSSIEVSHLLLHVIYNIVVFSLTVQEEGFCC